MDRNNDRVAKLYDSLHPAVLMAIRHVIERVQAAGKPIGVCGEMAGDPAAALLLLAMGADSLSMNLGSLLKIKWLIRTVRYDAAQQLLLEAMTLNTAAAIRDHANLSGAAWSGRAAAGRQVTAFLVLFFPGLFP